MYSSKVAKQVRDWEIELEMAAANPGPIPQGPRTKYYKWNHDKMDVELVDDEGNVYPESDK